MTKPLLVVVGLIFGFFVGAIALWTHPLWYLLPATVAVTIAVRWPHYRSVSIAMMLGTVLGTLFLYGMAALDVGERVG